MDEEPKTIDFRKYRKSNKSNKDDEKLDAEALKVWHFAGDLETVLMQGLETVPSIHVTGVLANRLGEMIRCVYSETGVDITEQILEMVRKYSK